MAPHHQLVWPQPFLAWLGENRQGFRVREYFGSKLGLQCRIARNVIFMAVRVDDAANREVVHRFKQLTDSVGAAGVHHETVNPVGSGKVKASAAQRAGQTEFSYFTDLFDLYHRGYIMS